MAAISGQRSLSSLTADEPPDAIERVYKPGSRADFDRLYRDSYGKVVAVLTGMLGGDRALAEDCAQDAFTRAFKAWPAYRPEAPAEAWVLRIAINAAVSERRRGRLREVGELVRRLGRPEPPADPAELGTRPVVAALRKLKAQDAAILLLRHHHGYSNREIAASTGVPESTVSARLIAARERLRQVLAREGVLMEVVRTEPRDV